MTVDLIELKSRIPKGKESLFAKEIAEIEKIKRERMKLLEGEEKYRSAHGCEYFRPWKWQRRAIEELRKTNILIVPAPNDIGKTALMANIILSWVYGYEPWTKARDKVSDDYMQADRFWYRKSSLGIDVPVRLRVTGEDWTHHIGETITKELDKWAIVGSFETRKNSNPPVVCLYLFKNGSTIELMTHSQKIDLFESWKGHGWAPDEPPPEDVFESMSRGITGRNGKVIMFMTPLKESWVLNNLIEPENKRYDVGVIDELTFLDNEELYNFDRQLLLKNGCLEGDIDKYFELLLAYEDKSKADHVRSINDHIKNVIIDYRFIDVVGNLRGLKKINDTSEENRESRFKGVFKSLVGRIYKNYKDFYYPNGHLMKPFKIPLNWVVICQVDFHFAEKMVVNFYAFDEMNRLYVIYEIFERLSAKDIAHEMVRMKKSNSWRLERAFIDPLSKGDDKSLVNRLGDVESSYTILKKLINPQGILLDTGSKDKHSGVDNIRERLCPANGIPTVFVFDNCIHHRRQFKQWGYTKDGTWSDVDDHCMETVGRATLCGVRYTDPSDDKYESKPDRGII